MKKLSLFMILSLIGTFGFAQVIFQIQPPSTPVPLQNTTYPLTYSNEGGATDWGSPDLTVPANSVTAELMFVDDGTAGIDANGNPLNQDACEALINVLTGKIAVLYRGACEFGSKALAAQNAGAIAVVIINHTGAPVGMGGGADGLTVTIPVIMISEQDGDYLKADIAAGTITQAFIGNKFGIVADDLGMRKGDVLRARRFSNIQALSKNATEFNVPLGAYVRNFGNQTQSNATLTATITLNATQIYSQSATVPTLAMGDSAWVGLPTFSQPWYNQGYYDVQYTVATSPTADGEPSDNVIDASFMISDSLYSYGRVDPATLLPLSPAGYRSGAYTTDWEGCLAFDDPNGSRLFAMGMTVSASTSSTDVLTGEFVEARVYQWDDVFTDLNDPAVDFANLVQLDAAFYVYGADIQDVPVFIPYSAPIAMADNQRYLFCLNTSSFTIFAGYDSQVDYQTTQDDSLYGHQQPSIPGASDGAYSLNGFGLDVQLAATVQFDAPVSVAEVDNEMNINPFPNPAVNELNIPVGDRNGSATIEIFDIAGKLIISNAVTFNNNEIVTVDVSAITNGSYVGKMNFEDGTSATFNVVVTR
jgi:PA domain-containing protein/type IX secretion system substrate protein